MSLAIQTCPLSVIKIGGSVLTDAAAFRRCADWLHRRLESDPGRRCVVVVSAELGVTDRLARLAESLCPNPDPVTLDLLWSTGELRSVAMLTLCLRRLGIAATALNVHQTGLSAGECNVPLRCADSNAQVEPLPLRYALAHHRIVVVPGFLARGASGQIVSLGRGGSDLTAVLLAAALNADQCELIKDVPGYFSQDPNACADADPLPRLTFEQALAMADAGCDLLQRDSIEAARRGGTPLVIRSLDESAPQTRVDELGDAGAWAVAEVAGDGAARPSPVLPTPDEFTANHYAA